MAASNNRRLKKEQDELENEPIEGIEVGPCEDLYHWTAMIEGPEETPYQGGTFSVDMVFPPSYPFNPPKVKFETRIYHPNVKTASGEICADVVSGNWSPTLNIRHVLCSIRQMMLEPNVESPLEPEIANLYANNREEYDRAAREMTEQFAGDS